MVFFEWSNKIELRVQDMDDEHKVLIKLMNSLFDLNEARAPKSDRERVFRELYEYTVKHFRDEEDYMKSINFPGFQTHCMIHKELLGTLNNHCKNYISSTNADLGTEVFHFLKRWLQAHIMGIDMKYADFSRSAA